MCPKPGNVGPHATFSDPATTGCISAADFVRSAQAVAPVISRASPQTVGSTVLQSIQQTRRVVAHNTNLGIVLLLTPLAAVPEGTRLRNGIDVVLDGLTVQDSQLVYSAIRLAEPGGLGEAPEQDVHNTPNLGLRACMQLAADRDLIAAQYANGFRQVLVDGMHFLQQSRQITDDQQQQITWTALQLLATFGDSLILRKCGAPVVDTTRQMAARVLSSGWPQTQESQAEYQRLDEFLRADGHRRNPGTTADMTAAIVFAALREGHLAPVGDWWSRVIC